LPQGFLARVAFGHGENMAPCADAGNSGLMLSMKTQLAFFVLIILSASAFGDDGAVGQYQLVPATVGEKVVSQDHVIFKIDTKTGTTWMYTCSQKDGKMYEFWHEVSERLK
jgi:hypothetical protein